MAKVRDRFWLWGHQAGSHNGSYGLPGDSAITEAEAADYMGIDNLVMVTYGGQPEPPFDAHARPMRDLARLVWSIVGDSSSTRNDRSSDLEAVVDLSTRFPNVTGAIMDDFFHKPNAEGAISRVEVPALEAFQRQLHAAPRPLDLWVVLYAHDLDLPVAPYLQPCDAVTFWTWTADELKDLESNFRRARALAPQQRFVLGCYMWDFGKGQPMPLPQMEAQCQQGLQWLQQGEIDGMIFLASCICDLGIEAVEWTRRWIAEVGDQEF